MYNLKAIVNNQIVTIVSPNLFRSWVESLPSGFRLSPDEAKAIIAFRKNAARSIKQYKTSVFLCRNNKPLMYANTKGEIYR